MAKKSQQEFVQHITPRDVDFSQWYTDVVRLADLMDYTPVRGCMAIKPYGYGIWELIQQAHRSSERVHADAHSGEPSFEGSRPC